jgi:hypothetical protein
MADRKLRNAERRRALRYLLTGVGPEPKEPQAGRVAHQTLSKLEYSLIEGPAGAKASDGIVDKFAASRSRVAIAVL